MCEHVYLCVLHARTIIVAVKIVKDEPQPLLVSPQVLRELLEVQQAIMVNVTLEDNLQRKNVRFSRVKTEGGDGGERCTQVKCC